MMAEAFELAAPERPTTWMGRIFALMQRMGTPMTVADVRTCLGIDLPDTTLYVAMRGLKAAGKVRFLEGSRRLYEIVPGATVPIDGRGRALGCELGRKRNPRAAKGLHHGVAGRRTG